MKTYRLLGLLLGVGMLFSCTKYEDDINNLQDQINRDSDQIMLLRNAEGYYKGLFSINGETSDTVYVKFQYSPKYATRIVNFPFVIILRNLLPGVKIEKITTQGPQVLFYQEAEGLWLKYYAEYKEKGPVFHGSFSLALKLFGYSNDKYYFKIATEDNQPYFYALCVVTTTEGDCFAVVTKFLADTSTLTIDLGNETTSCIYEFNSADIITKDGVKSEINLNSKAKLVFTSIKRVNNIWSGE